MGRPRTVQPHRLLWLIAAVLVAMAVGVGSGALTNSSSSSTSAGTVRIRYDARSFADSIPVSWFTKLSRVLAYPPAGDRYPAAGVQTLAYHDAYTKWGTNGLNPARRAEYVAWVRRDVAHGYAGQFLDDVNLAGGNRNTEPELAALVEAVRAAVGPSGVIEVNCQYVDLYPLMKKGDPYAARVLAAANVVDKEFNVDPTAGINTPSRFGEFLTYVDTLHAKGLHAVMAGDSNHNAVSDKEYSLATYFLLSDGSDFIGFSMTTPSNEWVGFSHVDLGEASSPRERSTRGIWKRTFSLGIAYVAEPGAPTQTITLPRAMKNLAGQTVSRVTLAPAHGAVLIG